MTTDLALYEAIVRSRRRARRSFPRPPPRKRRRARRHFDLASILYALSTTARRRPSGSSPKRSPSKRSGPKRPRSTRLKRPGRTRRQIGTRSYEMVADIGPYVSGFYNVRNVRGRAIVFRRSAALMRRFPSKSRAPCP